MTDSPRPIELLAPARDAATAIEAIRHGADAVYMGASSHGARAAAGNSIDDIRRVVDFAHPFGARVYVTVNTIVLDSEIAEVERLVDELYRAGVDALIVQDMALLRMRIPPIALHASTQCDIRTPERARFLAAAGFSQIVVARELSVGEMAAIHEAVPGVAVEAFVHGALCVSYSGDCQAGWMLARRSANRGECPQICRLAYDLIDGRGRTVVAGKHLLSLRDLNRSAHLGAMLEAGVTSFKIEGRLKDVRYVKNVVAAYRRELDRLIAASPRRYRRASFGKVSLTFTPSLDESFNRGFTDYFTTTAGRPSASLRMATFDSPKWTGTPVGTAAAPCRGSRLRARLTTPLANGDGIGFFDRSGRFCGVRVNRVDGSVLHLASDADIPAGTALYRNHNKLFAATLDASATASRRIAVSLTLRPAGSGRLALDAVCERGASATATVLSDAPFDTARTPQSERRLSALRKTGDTIYEVSDVDDRCGNLFIPAALLTDLRRRALAALDSAWAAAYRFDYRREPSAEPVSAPAGLTYHDNVANRLARSFYEDHGATTVEPALEAVMPDATDGLRVMQTRYCLRRELGACLRTPQGAALPEPLTLRSGSYELHCRFDCASCRMSLHL